MMRGLPFDTTAKDLVKFLQDFKVSESDCVIELKDGRQTGMAIAFLESEILRDEVIKKMDRKMVGKRYIELYPGVIRT